MNTKNENPFMLPQADITGLDRLDVHPSMDLTPEEAKALLTDAGLVATVHNHPRLVLMGGTHFVLIGGDLSLYQNSFALSRLKEGFKVMTTGPGVMGIIEKIVPTIRDAVSHIITNYKEKDITC